MGCTAPDGSRTGCVGLRDRVRGGAKGPHRAGRRAPASLRPMRQDPSARVGPPPLTVGRRAALHRERKSLPRCRTPHACGWCHRRAGCLRSFNKGHNEWNVGMTRRRLACTPQRRLVGGGAERVRLPAATAACTRMDRRAPCATPPAVRSRESQRMPEWQKPAGGRMKPPYRYGEGVHAAGRHGARRSSYVWASCQSRSPNRYSDAATHRLCLLLCRGLSLVVPWPYAASPVLP